MRINPYLLLVLVVAALVAGSALFSAAPAQTRRDASGSYAGVNADGRIPITGLPFTINECGHYYLASCVTGISGHNGISVWASHVTIDLNGFTISAEGIPGSVDAIHVAGPYSDITVYDGSIVGWGDDGIDADNGPVKPSGIRLENLYVSNNLGRGVAVGDRSLIRNCIAVNNRGHGIWAEGGPSIRVEGCVASGNGSMHPTVFPVAHGIALPQGGAVIDCEANRNSGVGIYHASPIIDSIASANGQSGVVVDGGLIARCVVSENSANGSGAEMAPDIRAESALVIDCLSLDKRTVAQGKNAQGILAGGGTVRGCVVSGHRAEEIVADSGSMILNNQCDASAASYGIHVLGNVRVEANHVTKGSLASVKLEGSGNFLVRSTAFKGAFDLGSGNTYGPRIVISGGGDLGGDANSDKSTANIEYQ